MTREEVAEGLRMILTSPDKMGVNIRLEDIRESSSLLKDFKLDSIQQLELIVAIENAFGFPIASRDLKLELLNEFRDLVDFIHQHAARKSAPLGVKHESAR